jgi:hypothetical protein
MNKLNNKHFQKQLQPLKVQDKEITDDKNIANCFTALLLYFTNAHRLTNNLKKQEKYFKRHTKTLTNSHFKEIFDSNFSEEELKQAIRNTKKKKQPGPNNIFPDFVHNLGPTAMKALTIYNKLWNSRDNLPDTWKKAIIVPTLKPGKPANLISSYRPIALTSILAKIQ